MIGGVDWWLVALINDWWRWLINGSDGWRSPGLSVVVGDEWGWWVVSFCHQISGGVLWWGVVVVGGLHWYLLTSSMNIFLHLIHWEKKLSPLHKNDAACIIFSIIFPQICTWKSWNQLFSFLKTFKTDGQMIAVPIQFQIETQKHFIRQNRLYLWFFKKAWLTDLRTASLVEIRDAMPRLKIKNGNVVTH